MPALSLSLANSVMMSNLLLNLINKKDQERELEKKQERDLRKSQARKKIRVISR